MAAEKSASEGLPPPSWPDKEEALRELDDYPEEMLPRNVPGYAEALAKAPKVVSKIDGMDITRFMGYRFCKSCAWTQINPDKTRACEDCVKEKFTIVKHGRHTKFVPLGNTNVESYYEKFGLLGLGDDVDPYAAGVKEEDLAWVRLHAGTGNCSVCTNSAAAICADCPLKVCDTCEMLLRTYFKGWLDKLIYHYGSEREHIRNDAFLLRSDNGGYTAIFKVGGE